MNTQPLQKTYLNLFEDKDSPISYYNFVKYALYDPELGYYSKNNKRVGFDKGTDFYTAESLGHVFSKLVQAAIVKIFGQDFCQDATFVEIGPEPEYSLLKGQGSLFKDIHTIRLRSEFTIPEKAIVFANELFDAQPFHRLIFTNGAWCELGIALNNDNQLKETLLPEISPNIQFILSELPNSFQENYIVDFPSGAEFLLKSIISQNFTGGVLFFDYGLMWEELFNNRPEGTARAYYKHQLSKNILSNVGEQDITHHICWDRLISLLKNSGFNKPTLERQEAFFVNNSQFYIENLVSKCAQKASKDLQTLKELIHPSLMGHKFQALWATN